MSWRGRSSRSAFALAGLLVLADPAGAAEPATTAPAMRAVYDWTGFYVGGHFGYGGGSLGPNTNPFPLQGQFLPHSVTGLTGGYQMGYNHQFASGAVVGVEADSLFVGPLDPAALGRQPPAPFNSMVDYVGTVRGRIGYAFGHWLPFLTGGFAWSRCHR